MATRRRRRRPRVPRSRSSRPERSFSTHYNRVMRIGRAIVVVVMVAVVAGIALRLVAQSSLRLRPYASGFTNPLAIVQDPGDRSVQFVLEQAGRIRVVRDGVILDNDFLDLRGAITSGGEQGLLGLVFPPDPSSP